MGINIKRKKIYIILYLSISLLLCSLIFLDSCSKTQELNFNCEYIWGSCSKIEGTPKTITKEEYSFENIQNITFQSAKIFPLELMADTAQYFEFKEKHWGDAGTIYRSEIYLDCQYTEELFHIELERLSLIQIDHFNYSKNSVLTYDLFNYPAYVTSYNRTGEFEYALYDQTNFRIVYIYLMGVGEVSNIVFDNTFIPYKKLKESDFCPELISKEGYYSIYWSSDL